MIDYLEDFCEMRNYTYSRLDGKMDIHERQSEVGPYSDLFLVWATEFVRHCGIEESNWDGTGCCK